MSRLREIHDALIQYGSASYELGATGKVASDERSQAHSRVLKLVIAMDRELAEAEARLEDLRQAEHEREGWFYDLAARELR